MVVAACFEDVFQRQGLGDYSGSRETLHGHVDYSSASQCCLCSGRCKFVGRRRLVSFWLDQICCFMFVKTKRSWPEAEYHCMSLGDKLVSVPNTVKYLGANLVSVHSSAEGKFLQKLIFVKTGSYPTTWIGGFDAVQAKVGQDRLWFWSDGSDFDHQNWAEGLPNNAGARETCIEMNIGGKRRWNNALCGRLLPLVCSLRLLPLRHTIS